MKKILSATLILFVLIAALYLLLSVPQSKEQKLVKDLILPEKKILFINSYHSGYEWSDGIEAGVAKTLREEGTGMNIDLQFIRMDTKRNQEDSFIKQAVIKVRKKMDSWKPDVVIASDDNAAKYLIAPYYKDSDIPFVFCGINWDASEYGFPASNVTGMIEVEAFAGLVERMKKHSRGSRLGYLGANIVTNRKKVSYCRDTLGIKFHSGYLVSNFDSWKESFLKLQKSVDMLINFNPLVVKNWNQQEAVNFIQKNSIIISGTNNSDLREISVIGLVKVPEEHGEWAAKKALQILKGKKPSEIPVETNKKGKILLNMKLARKLKVVFPMELINQAEFVGENE